MEADAQERLKSSHFLRWQSVVLNSGLSDSKNKTVLLQLRYTDLFSALFVSIDTKYILVDQMN